MVCALRPYSTYKDSGVLWLGQVPEHWQTRRIKHVAALDPSKSEVASVLSADDLVTFLPMQRVSSSGLVDSQESRRVSDVWNGFTYFRRSDVLVAKITPCFENGKGACLDSLPTEIGFGSTEFIVLRSSRAVLPRYLYRLTTVSAFRHLGADAMMGAAGQQRVPTAFVSNFETPVPPLPEQVAIVRYLDYADRKVRHAIRARQQLIKLLMEQKQAIIQRAVTRGLDPNARLKPSGIPWLGDVPEHWEVARLKHLCRFSYGDSLPTEIRQDGGIPVFGSNGCVGLHSVANTHAPCIVIGRKGSFGKIHFSETPVFAIDTTYFVDDRCTHANLHWFAYLLASLRLDGVSKDSAVPGLDRGDAYDQVVAYPIDAPEQSAIAQYLDRATADIDKAIDAARREIDLLREYRTRLIADVVTGKLDVRDAAAHLPDEPEEQPEPLDEELVDDVPDPESEEESDDEQAET